MSEYYLSNPYIKTKVKEGRISSIQQEGDTAQTEFVLPGEGFANLLLTTSEDGKVCTKLWSECEIDSSKAPVFDSRCLSLCSKADFGSVSAAIEYRLEGKKLHQKIVVTNQSERTILLKDAAISLPCNTKFEWGEPAGQKVIGHHFFAGDGSHMTYTRCDGKAPTLMVVPDQGTGIEYYNVYKSKAEIEAEKTQKKEKEYSIYAYMLGSHAVEEAIDKGFKKRLDIHEVSLFPGESKTFGFTYLFANGNAEIKKNLVALSHVDVTVFPSMTVPRNTKVTLCLQYLGTEPVLIADDSYTEQKHTEKSGDAYFYEIIFHKLGENSIRVEYDGQYMKLDFFVTEPIRTLIQKRGAFIASKQHKDESKWYNGLLAEWNNETGVMLGPDEYDKIKGWRIYEVTCDDPGLSKPAFLSSKLTEYPVQDEVDALDYYCKNFVHGGLQCTKDEPFPYAIYGIPDWYKNRNSEKTGTDGKLHLWRIYDYPHIALMYFNLYKVARDYESIHTLLSKDEYLDRAYQTALAMFLVPEELEGWSAYKTGLYNELVIPKIIAALQKEGRDFEAKRLDRHWLRKIKYFVTESKDIFGSEYPFDTTGFESTYVLAKEACLRAEKEVRENKYDPPLSYADAVSFMETQNACNIACRGVLEPAYYWYGSDYRGRNHSYTLSYMSQMGGYSLLDYALKYSSEPFELLRLAYGSIVSSWALLNSGDEKSNYGWFFPGKEHDGAASGGFEPLPFGMTWLEQPHHFGAWYYSCEIDLGFCGALRSAASILAEDPVFGRILYGGELEEVDGLIRINCLDGVGRRFSYVASGNKKLHLRLNQGHFCEKDSLQISADFTRIELHIDPNGTRIQKEDLRILGEMASDYSLFSWEKKELWIEAIVQCNQ